MNEKISKFQNKLLDIVEAEQESYNKLKRITLGRKFRKERLDALKFALCCVEKEAKKQVRKE